MILLNFSHPLNSAHLAQVEALTGQVVERVIEMPVQFDLEQSLVSQVAALVDRVGLTREQWQTLPLLVNPPGYAPGTAVLLAELHGRIGHFPAILWMPPEEDGPSTTYEVAEIINLQAVRAAARKRRLCEG